MGPFARKDKGNVFCTSRHRAPVLAAVFDALSFPMLVEQRAREGSTVSGARGTRQQKEPFDQATTAPGAFTQAYVNIRPFCQPFPACAAAHLPTTTQQ
jgi:hypothetical protein